MGKYQIGYKKPPHKNRFQKGKSGNPNGRPKKSRNLKTLIKKEMESMILIQENGETKNLSKIEAIVKGLFSNALKQDPKAIRTLLPILLQMSNNEEELQSLNKNIMNDEADFKILERFLGSDKGKENEP